MDKLANYGSDDDYDDSPGHRKPDPARYERPSAAFSRRRSYDAVDVNYDDVQMDISEDTDSSTGSNRDRATGSRNRDDYRTGSGGGGTRHPTPRERRRTEDHRRDSRHRGGSRDDRYGDRYSSRDKYHRSDRDDRRGRRSQSKERERDRDRARSRSPAKRSDYYSKREDSRDGDGRNYGKKYEKPTVKIGVPPPQKIQVEPPVKVEPAVVPTEKKSDPDKDRFFMPGITGRFRDQIERRKLLWQKKDDAKPVTAGSSTSTKVWQTTTFAQDADGKVASKFKRLMGIKDQAEEAKQPTDVLKKQEEMFSSMEQQYEVARTATHTMRGVGLGFGSYQR